MQGLRIVLQENVSVSEMAMVLNCTSELYKIFSLAYSSPTAATYTSQSVSTLLATNVGQGQNPWLSMQDLQVINISSGSFIFDLAEKCANSKAFGKLIEWLSTLVNPNHRRKGELDLEKLKHEIDNQEILDRFNQAKASIEVGLKGIQLINEAREMHDKLRASGFPDHVAQEAFYSAVRCFIHLGQIQEQKNIIVSLEIIKVELVEKEK